MFFVFKAALSGVLIAVVSAVARRYPGFGALIASLPLVSILGMLWLWQETKDPTRMEIHVGATFWYIIPSLPMFLLITLMMRHGIYFYWALALGCGVTIFLYGLTARYIGMR
ncbi:DUF3147 family protein [Gluconacetobacter sacchari]|uniref:DUF3147 family protein n=1 Tax=Gluconacetobacter sacchari TaxID=92759 RepID=UPI0039B4B70B